MYKSQITSTKLQTNSKKQIQNSKQKGNSTIEQLSHEAMDASDIARLEEVARAYHAYQQILLDNNALDFGDLINYH